ncbi:MAG: GWxTD domain-containing protein [Bacteroidia bacterium]
MFLSAVCPAIIGQHLELRFIPGRQENLQIWLRQGLFQAGDQLSLAVENKAVGQFRNKDFKLEQDSLPVLLWELAMKPGGCEAKLESHSPPFHEISASINIPASKGPVGSSLVLSTQPLSKLDQIASQLPVYSTSDKKLFFSINYLQCSQDQLSVRAILYKNDQGKQEATYASLEQIAAILRVQQGQATFRGSFHIDSLPAGKYLIEVLAYEDDRIIPELERSREFSLRWAGLATLLDSPRVAIRRMEYIAGKAWVTETLALEPAKQAPALLSFWKAQSPREPERLMAGYFERLGEAEKRFSPAQSDLCRIFSLYGEAKTTEFSASNTQYQRWFYPQTGITFLFRRETGRREPGIFKIVH